MEWWVLFETRDRCCLFLKVVVNLVKTLKGQVKRIRIPVFGECVTHSVYLIEAHCCLIEWLWWHSELRIVIAVFKLVVATRLYYFNSFMDLSLLFLNWRKKQKNAMWILALSESAVPVSQPVLYLCFIWEILIFMYFKWICSLCIL